MPRLPQNLLVDLDGTLTDSAPGILNGFAYALARHGLPCPPVSELGWTVGPPLRESLLRLLPTSEHTRIESYVTAYREHYVQTGIFENVVYPGIPGALQSLRAAGFRLRLATSKPRVYAERILRHFGLEGHFEAIYGSELSGERSNKAELIRHILVHDRLDADLCVMIGDREHDVRGGRHNGTRTLGVLWGYGSREELLAAGAHGLCAHPEELPSALAGAPAGS